VGRLPVFCLQDEASSRGWAPEGWFGVSISERTTAVSWRRRRAEPGEVYVVCFDEHPPERVHLSL
jgi:hypothetical protein